MCLCEYGCGLDAQYQLKNKRWCCSKSPNSCINIRKKNSATIKKLHAEGICVVGFNDTSKWWTYKSKEEVQQIYNKISITLKQKFKTGETKPSFLGKHHTEEVRSKISDARLKFLSQNKDFGIKWKKIKNILGEEISVQGTWEYAVAEWLNTNNIIFKRLPLIFQKIRKYTPDFYLPELNIYLEVKGWWKDRDIYKTRLCLEEYKDISIKIIGINEIKKLKDINIADLEDFNDKFKDYVIDFSKFKNVWK